MAESQLAKNIKAITEKVGKVLTPEETVQYGLIITKLNRAKDNRNAKPKYLDGMDYVTDYITNEDNKNSYLSPKVNDADVRINAGTSEKKLDAIRNEFLTMDFDASIKAYDVNDLHDEYLSEDMTHLVKRTKQQEKNPIREDADFEALDDLIAQRGCFRQEYLQTLTFQNGKSATSRLANRTISGLKVFPGDMTLSPYLWNLQPFIVLYDRMNYQSAKMMFSHLPNFKYVLPNNTSQLDIFIGQQFDYRFDALSEGEIEVVTYESLPDNEYQVLINGVPMYAPGTPLPWSYNMYDVQFFTGKPMSRDYLLGRPFTSMAKSMQFVQNETIRLLMRKFHQAVEPPVGTPKSGKTYSKEIWDPSAITQGISKATFERLIDHDGITQSEFQLYNLIESKTEEFIGASNISQGLAPSREMSATEVLSLQKAFIKQLGYTVAARVRMENVLTEQRVFSIIDNYLSPIGKKLVKDKDLPVDMYRTFTLEEAVLDNKQFGKKIIYMIDEDLTREELEMAHEYEENQKRIGNNIRLSFLNVKKLKEMNRYFFAHTEVKDKQGTALDKIMYQEQLNQATVVRDVTQTPLNSPPIVEGFERTWKARDWFQKKTPQMMMEEQALSQTDPNVQAQAEQAMGELDQMEADTKMENSGSQPDQVRQGLRGRAISQANQVDTVMLAAQ